MTPRHLIACLGCVALTGCGSSGKGGGLDQDRLQGTWRVERVEIGGKVQDDDTMAGLTYTFEGAKLVVEVGGTRHEGTVALDTSHTPHTIDLKPTAGNQTDQPIQGVYAFESNNNAPRSRRFRSGQHYKTGNCTVKISKMMNIENSTTLGLFPPDD